MFGCFMIISQFYCFQKNDQGGGEDRRSDARFSRETPAVVFLKYETGGSFANNSVQKLWTPTKDKHAFMTLDVAALEINEIRRPLKTHERK